MASREDLLRKQDHIDIVFDEGRKTQSQIRRHNLGNLAMQTHKFSDRPYDFVLYGMTMSESKVSKTFIIRSPFIIMN